jgi:hypothetical protein
MSVSMAMEYYFLPLNESISRGPSACGWPYFFCRIKGNRSISRWAPAGRSRRDVYSTSDRLLLPIIRRPAHVPIE